MKKSKKASVLIFLMCLAVAGLLVGGIALQKAHAQGLTLSELLFPNPPAGTTVIKEELSNPLLTQTEAPTNSADTSSPAAALTNDNGQDIQTRAIELVKKADETYLKPGWLHILTIEESFPSGEKVLPNGDPIPTKSSNNAWYLLGEKGLVSQAVIIDDTGDALTTQNVIYKDGYWKNLTIPELSSAEKEDYQIKTLDQGLLGSDHPSRNFTYALEEDTENTIVVNKTELFNEPVLFDQTIKAKGVVSKYTLSKESGRTLALEIYLIYPDDTFVLWERLTTVVVENAESAPDQILSFLQN